MTEGKFSDLAGEEQELLLAAEQELPDAYNPYNSGSRVGAAVRTAKGKIIGGASMANVSSTANLCAERVAIAAANTAGERDIVAIALIGTDADGVVENPVMPCGLCRQFIQEIVTETGHDIEIICSNSDKTKIIRTSLSELLPLPYIGGGTKTEKTS
ncbi:MAG: cytidine deaminase [Candidatus Vogelbacteria bacterium]|nr:cytidine deaminase [Candidatus Vogelbacteria bacterium]